jgi:amino acid adenylation domain-containing protein
MSVETRILSAWEGVLQVGPIAPDDDFFEIGGDSAAALRVIDLLVEQGLAIPLRSFYEGATAAGQAALLTARAAKPAPAEVGAQRLPLAPLQSVMLVESLRNPDDDAFWIVAAYPLPTDAPLADLVDAWQATVRANPVLRTTVMLDADGPHQAVAPTGPDPVPAHLDGDELRKWCFDRLREARALGPYAPAMAYIVADVPALVLVQHHVLMDGWSLAQCVTDFRDRLADPSRELPPRPSARGYYDWLDRGDAIPAAEQFWGAELSGVEPAPPLQFERTSGRQPVWRLREQELSPAARAALNAFAAKHRLTAASVVTATWAQILAQYQDTGDITIGVTVNNRPAQLPGTTRMSGFLINTVPLRISAGDDFRHVMNKLAAVAENAHLPYSRLVEIAGLPGMTELFTSTLVFQNFVGDAAAADRVRPIFAHGTSADPLGLTVDIRRDGVTLSLGWDESRYGSVRPAGLLSLLERRLEELAAPAPATPLTVAEPRPWSIGRYLPASDALAITDGTSTLTYDQLRTESLQLAEHLATSSVRAGDRVAFIGRRNAQAVVAICASWLLGASWCALDPAAPASRTDRVLNVLKPVAVVDLLGPRRWRANKPDLELLATTMPVDAPAYYMATSGSTGEPKLVALSAGGLQPLVDAWLGYYDIDDRPQRVLQIGSWTSDVFLGDLLKSLSTRGTLVICPDERRIDLPHVRELVCQHDITLVESTPSFIRALVTDLAAGARPATLTTLIAGADTFRFAEMEAILRELWPQARLYNGYGLSECTIESSVYRCVPGPAPRSGLCPIGTPLPGTAVLIVNEHGEPVPPGAVGELVIAGPQVALGYLTADGLQASADRRWRTGDFVRLSDEDALEFFGRRDNRVKVRGHRVELGEIEDCLLRRPGVDEAYVRVDRTDLVAFAAGLLVPDGDALRADLARHLPAHAVPSRIVTMKALPRNGNGKVDRVTLANEDRSPATRAGAHAPLVRRLADVWADVLRRPVNPDRSFFDQGGNSLSMLTLFERLQAELPNHEFTIGDLFRHVTVRAFAEHIGGVSR